MSELLSRERCEVLFDVLTGAARALGIDDLEATLAASSSALTRFANNAIHQNVAERGELVSVRLLLDGRTARASTNRSDEEGLRQVVAEAAAITRLQERDADLLPLADPEPEEDI